MSDLIVKAKQFLIRNIVIIVFIQVSQSEKDIYSTFDHDFRDLVIIATGNTITVSANMPYTLIVNNNRILIKRGQNIKYISK